MQRVILHCDMNNFYASVECMLNPELKNGRGNLAGKTEVPGSCDRGAAL